MCEPDSDVRERVERLAEHYMSLNLKIESFCDKLERYSGLYEDNNLNLPYSSIINSYRIKLQTIRQFILEINDKISWFQQKLNRIRFKLPKGHVYVESGPLLYRCIYKGGVRFRNYPSVNAKILNEKPIVKKGEIVEISQRVFITKEECIFLVS